MQEQAVAGLLREPALPAAVLKPLVDGQTKEIRDIARRSEGRLGRIETSVVAGADLQTHLLAEINELRSMIFGLTDTVAQMSRVLKMVGDLAGGVPLPPAIDET